MMYLPTQMIKNCEEKNILGRLQFFFYKSCIQETPNLLTDADSSTATKKLLSKLFLPPPGSVLDTTLLETPPPSKVCKTSFAQNPGRGAPPLLKSVQN